MSDRVLPHGWVVLSTDDRVVVDAPDGRRVTFLPDGSIRVLSREAVPVMEDTRAVQSDGRWIGASSGVKFVPRVS